MRLRCCWKSCNPAIALFAFLLFALAGTQASAQVTVRGIVRSTDGKTIASAEVGDRASGLTTYSDSAGAFLLADVPLGDRTIDVRRIGFVADQFPIVLTSGRNRLVALTLTPLAQALPDVSVADKMAKPARYADTHKYDEFYSRRAMGFGTFLTREDIDRKFKANSIELLQDIPGIRVRRDGNEWKLQSVRCQLGLPMINGQKSDPGQFIRVFIDGHDMGSSVSAKAGQETSDAAEQLSSINPAEIEAMEIYKSPAELPAEARGKGCAAIFIWTRNGH